MYRLWAIALTAAVVTACTSLPRYTASFSEVDQNRDAAIEWREFKTRYPDADPKAFMAADQNKNGDITPDEWQFFVETQTP